MRQHAPGGSTRLGALLSMSAFSPYNDRRSVPRRCKSRADPAKKKRAKRREPTAFDRPAFYEPALPPGRPGVIKINRRPFFGPGWHFDGIAVEEVGGPSPARRDTRRAKRGENVGESSALLGNIYCTYVYIRLSLTRTM